ncbi:MAG: hypothetical protein ACJ71U_15740 [Terriglobales bacterium]
MSPDRKQQRPPDGKKAAAGDRETDAAQVKSGRKPWVKKTPVEVVLEQIAKQEERVARMREELKKEERELQKLQQAKKVLEATQ